MKTGPHPFAPGSPESKTREVIDACADGDCCRPPMDPACVVFEFLSHQGEKQIGRPYDKPVCRSSFFSA
jgi:hypothetical protein